MAQPSYPYPPSPNPVGVIIGAQFIAPYPIEVIVVTNSSGDHLITDVNHKILFKVKPCNTSNHVRRVLLDADDTPIVMMHEKFWSAHSGWKVFKGDSNADSEMIFSTKTPKIIQSKTNVHVFLGNKTRTKGSCDFKITGSWSKRSCTIYMGDSSTVMAQMQKIEPPKFIKDKFMVKIYPYVDYAFVVTLIAIVEAMKSSDDADEVIDEVTESIAGIGTIFS